MLDATSATAPPPPGGAWVRVRADQDPPGEGPVIRAGGDPVPGRPTWLETGAPGPVPEGFEGLVLKGREAGGHHGEEDGLALLARCPDPGRVILDAGCGPHTAAAAAALGARSVLIAEAHLGLLDLPDPLAARLRLADDEVTSVVGGVRIGHAPTAPVVRRLLESGDPWALAADLWSDPEDALWMVGQGLALARDLAERHGSLPALIRAFRDAFEGWRARVRTARAVRGDLRPATTAAGLLRPGTVAEATGSVGSGVLWQEAVRIGRPVRGEPLQAAAALGGPVVAPEQGLAAVRDEAGVAEAPTPSIADRAPRGPEAAPAVAIVGLGCRLPDAHSVEAFWDNVVHGRSAIIDVPPERWDPALYWDPEGEDPDRTYTRIGGFLRGFEFDSRRFRIPPKVAEQIDPVQQITLESVADALADAGLQVDPRRDEGRPFDRATCAVILGNSLGGEIKDRYAVRLTWPEIARTLRATALSDRTRADQDALLALAERALKEELPEVTEDSMPGELSNVIAGRIANAFDLGGANFTVDAACASSMAALQAAVKGLQDGDFDLAVTGGADRSMNLPTYVKFCRIGALSPDHSAPFDASANGFVMGEGCGILVLKRYEDAVADGDRVYAVIRGIGASSDGRGKGITAPNIRGQILALRRAYAAAGLDPWQVDLIEAHGTSTVVGDKVEVEALNEVIGAGRRDDPIRIGSVKSMIGHLKSAAGAASLIKASLALHHGVLPPSLGFDHPAEGVPLAEVPLQVQTRAEPWPGEGLRRCGVSAFGFGGTNFHVILESFAGQELPRSRAQAPPAPQPTAPGPRAATSPPASTGSAASGSAASAAPAASAPARSGSGGGAPLPEGIWATSGEDAADLVANLRALAAGRTAPWDPAAPMRIAAAARDAEERAGQIERAIATVDRGRNPELLKARGIHLLDGPVDGDLALLFTGQGSQYADMGRDLADAYPLIAETFAEADAILEPTLGRPITDFIYLQPGEDRGDKQEILRRTEYSQPATLTLDVALLRLLAAHGIAPDQVAGHSLGEYGAAVAAGVMTFEQALTAVSARGREMASIRLDDPGKMAGIATSTETVSEVLAEIDGYVIPANKNCPTQTVIAGSSDAVDEAMERFRARNITVYPLPVSHAFHSSIVAPASEPLRGVLEGLGLQPPRRPITTNVTGGYYPTGEGAVERIIDLLATQISAPVEWTAQMETMYADGARVFVECGPKRALTGFTVAILKRRPHIALYTNHPKRGGVWSFRDALAGLLASGFPVRPAPVAEPDLFFEPAPRQATRDAIATRLADREEQPGPTEARPDLARGILEIVAESTGYDLEDLDLDYELEADLGIDTVKQAEVFSRVRETWSIETDDDFSFAEHRTLRSLIDWAADRVGATRPAAPVHEPEPAAHPAASPASDAPGASDAPRVEPAAVDRFLDAARQVDGLDARAFAEAMLPAMQGLVEAAFEQARREVAREAQPPPVTRQLPAPTPAAPSTEAAPAPAPRPPAPHSPDVRVVCAGASVGLPGGDEVFAPDNFARILAGENRIEPLGGRAEEFLDLDLVRLVKDAQTGEGSFLPVEDVSEVIRLAGVRRDFDLGDYGVSPRFQRALDITTQMAMAAGIEALRDAGIPLVRTFKTTRSGKQVPKGWALPEPLRDGTGVIFASAFPGYSQLVEKLATGGDDGEGRFDRRFLFQVLAMGHSQFAQFIGARGPNTQVNAACASTTQAIALASDWIRLGRCERVVVIGADDVTNEQMLKWIGGGFMAAGAATTEADVTKAALPFDRRRHGMILGMGAVGLVVERDDATRERGVVPIAELLDAVIANSAFHGTRLHPEHIADHMRQVVERAAERAGTTPRRMAASALFMSHETYTPARGGSAAAEIEALRAAFGDEASAITIANTKGFTGHAMGAGIEDAVALKALQHGRIPPVANFEQPDEDLGDLRISRGEQREVDFAVRLAAGFGSQLAIAVWQRLARGDHRVPDPARRAAWLRRVTGFDHVEEQVEDRTLRALPAERDRLLALPTLTGEAPRPLAEVDEAPAREPAFTPGGSPVRRTLPPDAPTDFELMPGSRPVDPARSTLRELQELVADKTGYDPDELDPEFELEADLGIDTVKQAEIFSELRDRYGLERDDDFRLSEHPTLDALASWLDQARARSMPEPEAAAEPTAEQQPAPEAAPSSPGPDTRTIVPGERTILPPAEDTWTPPTERRLAAKTEGWAWESVPLPGGFRIRRPVLVPRPVRSQRDLAGSVVHVLGVGPTAEAIRGEATRRGATLRDGPGAAIVVDAGVDVFDSLQTARELDDDRPERWIAVTRLGGLVPDVPSARAFSDGARAGFCKALGREWAHTRARVVDVPPDVDEPAVARAVCDELLVDQGTEVFRRGAQRRVVAYRLEDTPEPGALPEEATVLITGGARGVGARVAEEIARRGPVRLVLVGRTPAPEAETDLDAAKRRIKEELSAEHDRVTPAMVEERLRPLRKGNAIRATLDRLVTLGAEVDYRTVDLADPEAARALVDAVREQSGRLDVVIHCAGVEESRLIGDKDAAAFHRVFDGKARGGRALLDALDDTTRFVSMGSVAGRFGNAGQVDYAAANDAMARLCLNRPAALHVDWTAWDDVGMAVRGGMKRLLEDRGVQLLPADAGAGLLVDLIADRAIGEIVVAGELGDMSPEADHPLLDRVDLHADGVSAYRTLSLDSDPWIEDHAIEGTPVLPGVIGLELMTAAACAASPGLPAVGARQVRFAKPVKLHRGEPVEVIVRAEPVDPYEVRCTLISERRLATGRVQRTEHFRATIVLGELFNPEPLPSAFFPDEALDRHDIYRRFFHGPRFQVLDEVAGIAKDGLVARAKADWDAIAPYLLTEPLAVEAAFQAAGLHHMVEADQQALPAGIDEIRFSGAPPSHAPAEIMVHHDGVSYDIDVDGPDGPVLKLRGLSLVDTRPLPPGDRFERPAGGRPRCFPTRRGTDGAPPRREVGPEGSTARATWGEDDPAAWLTPEELSALRARGTERRQRDRIAGRVAAKRALAALTGAPAHTIRIRTADSGEPLAEVPSHPGVRVSITHRDGVAVAVASRGDRVGVDLEQVEERPAAFAEDWFTADERALVGDDPERQTLVWSIKEAVLKALGAGLALSPREVVVTALDAGRATVELRDDAAATHRRLGGGRWSVRWQREGSASVLVTARLAA